MTRRYYKCCQNQSRSHTLGQVYRISDYWVSGNRRIGGVSLAQALERNYRNQSCQCQGRRQSGHHHKGVLGELVREVPLSNPLILFEKV